MNGIRYTNPSSFNPTANLLSHSLELIKALHYEDELMAEIGQTLQSKEAPL